MPVHDQCPGASVHLCLIPKRFHSTCQNYVDGHQPAAPRSAVIAKKNALINSINLDSKNNIIISIGGIVNYSEDYSFYPQIITDKLDEQGKFINDLFVK